MEKVVAEQYSVNTVSFGRCFCVCCLVSSRGLLQNPFENSFPQWSIDAFLLEFEIFWGLLVLVGGKVDLRERHNFGLPYNSETEPHDREHWDFQVKRQKVGETERPVFAIGNDRCPPLQKDECAVDEDDKERRPCPERASKRQTFAQMHALGLERAAKPPVGPADAHPCDLVGHADQRLNPIPKTAVANEAGTKAEGGDEGGEEHGVDRRGLGRQLPEHFMCVPLLGESEEQARAGEERVVSSGNDGCYDDCVHYMSGDINSGKLED